MRQISIRKNFIYGMLLKLSNVVLPLVTFPYIARVLSPTGLGKVDFALSVIQYFVVFSQLGIPAHAVRECAKVRDDKAELAKRVQELLFINLLFIAVSYFLLVLMVSLVPAFKNSRELFMIVSLNVFATGLGVEWFFHAIEDYRYITFRSIIVKFISIAMVFTLIKSEDDFALYALINVLSIFLASALNFWKVSRLVPLFNAHKDYDLHKHLKPILMYFGAAVSVAVYNNFDTTLLGLLSGETAVGLYSASNKLVRTMLPFVTTLSVILVPRVAYHVSSGNDAEASTLIDKALSFVLMIGIPSAVGIYSLAQPIMLFFVGEDYEPAIATLQILSLLIPLVGVSNCLGAQVLGPYGQERRIFLATFLGAIASIAVNFILIPQIHQNGAAISAVVAEITVVTTLALFASPYLKRAKSTPMLLKYLAGGLAVFAICYLLKKMNLGNIETILLSVSISAPMYFTVLVFLGDPLAREVLQQFTGFSARVRR